MDDAAADQTRARRWRIGLALVLAVGLAGAGVALMLRPAPTPWVVEVTIERPGLDFDDPCSPMPSVITGGYLTGGGSYGGLIITRTEADAETVAACYRKTGATIEVRRQTGEDAQRVKEVAG